MYSNVYLLEDGNFLVKSSDSRGSIGKVFESNLVYEDEKALFGISRL